MKKLIKEWFIKSALIDFQEWNWYMLCFAHLCLFILIHGYSSFLAMFTIFFLSILAKKYNKLWRKYYHFAICDTYKIKPKTLNLTFN